MASPAPRDYHPLKDSPTNRGEERENRMIKIMIVDDHEIVRKGLKQILKEAPHIAVAGEASTGQEAMEKLKKNPFDMLVLDISLPDRSGLEVLKQVRQQYPKIPVLILTMHAEEQYAARVLRAGAAGYMTKEAAPEQLVNAIQKVSRGGRYVSPAFAETLAFDLGADPTKPLHETLSDREYQVMTMLASGKPVKDIAEKLYLSVKTVSTHRSRILEKMRMRNNAELILYAIRNNLVN
jgi:two-component system, NarL family, invasion response regulator UvrY